MEFGVMEDTGIILLTGNIGTGKTTLIRHMLTKFENDIQVATIYKSNVNSNQLLAMILQEFGLESEIEHKPQAFKAIKSGLEKMHQKGQKPVIIIDDAQNLSMKTLEEVRQLSNLQSQDRMLVQIILVGQPELKEKLEEPALSALVQRIGLSYHITPFNREETIAYITHRLKVAGAYLEIFDPESMETVYEVSQGNPRTINLICDHALVYGFADEIKTINSDVILQVINDNPGLDKRNEIEGSAGSILPVKEPVEPDEEYSESAHSALKQEAGNWQQRIENRLQILEQLMTEYNRELRDVIKSMFEKERQKNDNLILKYARLESESKALRKELAQKKSRQPPSQ